MTEEEYFRKNYPDSCYGDKPLSPHWDFFQDGVEFGERQSEKRIEELEATNKTISNECHKLVDTLEKKQNEVAELQHLIKTQDRKLRQQSKVCDEAIDRVETLVKENTELKSELTKKADTNHSLVEQMADLESKNAELEKKNTALRQDWEVMKNTIADYNDFCDKYMRLEKENAELKKKLNVFSNESANACFAHNEKSNKLIKAREIILKLYNAGRDVLMCRTEEKAYDNLDEAINDKSIEQFIKE